MISGRLYTVQFAVETFLRNNDSSITAQRIFSCSFNKESQKGFWPQHNQELGKEVSNHGFLNTHTHKTGGRVRRVRIPENTERVRAAIGRSPKRSVRRHSVALNVSSSSLRRILQYDLYFHPYKSHIVQELSDRDFASRSVFCEQFFFLHSRTQIPVLFVTWKCQIRLTLNSLAVWIHKGCDIGAKLIRIKCVWNKFSQRVTEWSGISVFGTTDPYFFKDEIGSAVTVTSDRYVHMVNEFLFPELRCRDTDLATIRQQPAGPNSTYRSAVGQHLKGPTYTLS
jgi:hypothetical protein